MSDFLAAIDVERNTEWIPNFSVVGKLVEPKIAAFVRRLRARSPSSDPARQNHRVPPTPATVFRGTAMAIARRNSAVLTSCHRLNGIPSSASVFL